MEMQIPKKAHRYQPLRDPTQNIRILKLLPNDDPDIIACESEDVKLDDKPFYYALSYEWGEPMDLDVFVRIDGKLTPIRHNLWLFLSHLKSRKAAMVRAGQFRLWVDAVSINQNDMREKGHQVALMGRVFQQAYCVYAWLGWSGNINLERTFSNIKKLPTLALSTYDDDSWDSILRLLKLTYWSRRWIVQELILAKEIVLLYGNEELPWKMIESVFKVIPAKPEMRTKLKITDQTCVTIRNTSAYRVWQHRLFNPVDEATTLFTPERAWTRLASITSLLTDFGHTACEKNLDRIYAFRTMIRCGDSIEVDYDCNEVELFMRLLPPQLSLMSSGIDNIPRLARELNLQNRLIWDSLSGSSAHVDIAVSKAEVRRVIAIKTDIMKPAAPSAIPIYPHHSDVEPDVLGDRSVWESVFQARQNMESTRFNIIPHYEQGKFLGHSNVFYCDHGSTGATPVDVHEGDLAVPFRNICLLLREQDDRYKIIGPALLTGQDSDYPDVQRQRFHEFVGIAMKMEWEKTRTRMLQREQRMFRAEQSIFDHQIEGARPAFEARIKNFIDIIDSGRRNPAIVKHIETMSREKRRGEQGLGVYDVGGISHSGLSDFRWLLNLRNVLDFSLELDVNKQPQPPNARETTTTESSHPSQDPIPDFSPDPSLLKSRHPILLDQLKTWTASLTTSQSHDYNSFTSRALLAHSTTSLITAQKFKPPASYQDTDLLMRLYRVIRSHSENRQGRGTRNVNWDPYGSRSGNLKDTVGFGVGVWDLLRLVMVTGGE